MNANIAKADDWQARMNALAMIQSAVTGDGVEYMPLVVQCLKDVHEHVS